MIYYWPPKKKKSVPFYIRDFQALVNRKVYAIFQKPRPASFLYPMIHSLVRIKLKLLALGLGSCIRRPKFRSVCSAKEGIVAEQSFCHVASQTGELGNTPNQRNIQGKKGIYPRRQHLCYRREWSIHLSRQVKPLPFHLNLSEGSMERAEENQTRKTCLSSAHECDIQNRSRVSGLTCHPAWSFRSIKSNMSSGIRMQPFPSWNTLQGEKHLPQRRFCTSYWEKPRMKVPTVMGGILFSLLNAYVEVLMPSTSECDLIWR